MEGQQTLEINSTSSGDTPYCRLVVLCVTGVYCGVLQMCSVVCYRRVVLCVTGVLCGVLQVYCVVCCRRLVWCVTGM